MNVPGFNHDQIDSSPLPSDAVVITNLAQLGVEENLAPGDVALYIRADRANHLIFQNLCQHTHLLFTQAPSGREKGMLHKKMIVKIYERGGVLLSPRGVEWQEMRLFDVEQRVWDFLAQKCYVRLSETDVVLRGGGTQHLRGHQTYLRMRDDLGAVFTNASTDSDAKTVIAEHLVYMFQQTGGRFLSRFLHTDAYYVLDHAQVVRSAKRALGEYRPRII